MTNIEVFALEGIGEVAAGDDLISVIAQAYANYQPQDGDVLVVTSKIVSKAEARTLPAEDRAEAITAESFGEVATNGPTRIVRTRHGFVMAAAGVDASNTAANTILLLPLDPDATARQLRAGLQTRLGITLGVIISDTFGRPWREGLTDNAIGVAGVRVLHDHRGELDAQGRTLEQTVVATADELASAADLVKGKNSNCPVAVIRGSQTVHGEDGPGARALVRASHTDLFALGTQQAKDLGRKEAVQLRRTVRTWSDQLVAHELIGECVAAALTAPAPHHTTPWRFVHVVDPATRKELLARMADRWEHDLASDGLTPESVRKRVERGALLERCPELVIPVLVLEGQHDYPDERRKTAERDMFVLSMGAAVQSFMVTAAVQGLGTAWVSSTLFCPDDVRPVLEMPAQWHPMGAIAVGYPLGDVTPRPSRDSSPFLIQK
jgi:coenzyme F420-0:L-glutamate ligase/coenzyme F420-1:gamma-L-glutamate ligase